MECHDVARGHGPIDPQPLRTNRKFDFKAIFRRWLEVLDEVRTAVLATDYLS